MNKDKLKDEQKDKEVEKFKTDNYFEDRPKRDKHFKKKRNKSKFDRFAHWR